MQLGSEKRARERVGVQKGWEGSKNSGYNNISGPVHGWI